MMSTPACVPLPRGEPHPDETSGLRPFQTGTGHTQRPGRGAIAATWFTDAAAAVFARRDRDQKYASAAPPPTIQGSLLDMSRLARRRRRARLVVALAEQEVCAHEAGADEQGCLQRA